MYLSEMKNIKMHYAFLNCLLILRIVSLIITLVVLKLGADSLSICLSCYQSNKKTANSSEGLLNLINLKKRANYCNYFREEKYLLWGQVLYNVQTTKAVSDKH